MSDNNVNNAEVKEGTLNVSDVLISFYEKSLVGLLANMTGSRFVTDNDFRWRLEELCLSVCLWSNASKTGINDYVKRLFVYVVTVIEISSEEEEATPGTSKRQRSEDIENGKFIYSCASRCLVSLLTNMTGSRFVTDVDFRSRPEVDSCSCRTVEQK